MSDAQTIERLLAALAQRLAPETPYDRALRKGRERMARRHEYNLMRSWYGRHPIGTAVTRGAGRERLFVAGAPREERYEGAFRWMVPLSVDLAADPKGRDGVGFTDELRKVPA